MIPRDIVNELKKEYKEIYALSFGDIDIVYRPLNMGEFTRMKGKEYNMELEEEIVDLAVLYGDVDSLMAGSFSILADKILESSDFSDLDKQKDTIEQYREDMGLLVEQADALVSYVFKYPPEIMDSMTFSELMRKFVQAEYLLNMHYSHVQGAMMQQGSFKLTFPWEATPTKMENPRPMTHNQRKASVGMEQLQEHSMASAKRKLEQTLKKDKKEKEYFNWHEDL